MDNGFQQRHKTKYSFLFFVKRKISFSPAMNGKKDFFLFHSPQPILSLVAFLKKLKWRQNKTISLLLLLKYCNTLRFLTHHFKFLFPIPENLMEILKIPHVR